ISGHAISVSPMVYEIPGFFALRIELEMRSRGITIWDAATHLNCGYEMVRKILSREAIPTEELAQEFAVLLELDPADLLLRVERDRIFRQNGGATWELIGISPRLGPLYVYWEY